MSQYPFLLAGKDPSHWEGMDPIFRGRLEQMLKAAPGGGLSVFSGYRSPERQKQLYDAAVRKYGSPEAARKWVAPPGRSQHNHGTAADLKYASPEVRQWAHENAPKYGLQFRMGHEPWHVEPMKNWTGGASAQMASMSPSQVPSAPVPQRSTVPSAPVPQFSASMGTAMTGFGRPPQAPQMTAGVNPMQGAPGMPPSSAPGLAGLFGGPKAGGNPMAGIAEALMGGMGGMARPQQQQMAPANFVVPAAEPGSINPTPQGLTDPRMAALLKLLQQQA